MKGSGDERCPERRSGPDRIPVNRGFTLLQLLSLAAIVGIALSLLLPALLRWLGFNP
jgi:type II secretory pathway pseudopilin PulG